MTLLRHPAEPYPSKGQGTKGHQGTAHPMGAVDVPSRPKPTPVMPWTPVDGEAEFPFPIQKIQVDPGGVVPNQSSYLVWKYLHKNKIGDGQHSLDLVADRDCFRSSWHGTATGLMDIDIDPSAIAITMTNAFRNGGADRITGSAAALYTFETRITSRWESAQEGR